MLCRKVRGMLSAYTDGELSPTDACGVKSHLDRCEACSREHTVLRRLVSVTASIPMEEVPASLHERIVMRLAYADSPVPAVDRRARRSPISRSWAWAACTVAAAAVMAGTMNQRNQSAAHIPLNMPVSEASQPEPPAETSHVASKPSQAEPVTAEVLPHVQDPALEAQTYAQAPAETEDSATPLQATAPKVRKLVPERLTSAAPGAPTDRPQPVSVTTSGRPATEIRVSEPAILTPAMAMAKDGLMAMPGEPLMNTVGSVVPTEPVMPAEKDPTRMAGMAVEVETPGEEDEGLRSFRMFLQENSRTVPQPPTVRPRERGGRKAL